MVNLKLKGAVIAEYGSQAAAVQDLRTDIPGFTERRLSRLIHGYDQLRPEEAQVMRKKLGVILRARSE